MKDELVVSLKVQSMSNPAVNIRRLKKKEVFFDTPYVSDHICHVCSAVEFKISSSEESLLYVDQIDNVELILFPYKWLFKNCIIKPHFNNKVGEYIMVYDSFSPIC